MLTHYSFSWLATCTYSYLKWDPTVFPSDVSMHYPEHCIRWKSGKVEA